ncbi:hypothetical protein [Desulfoferrobacter suflitae]|uniref:hypothetical protein n=1 Tax=Desulfoferrobacter suflitae TaxID=2865782 RepID=UPI002164DE98|nr:hypothetical protein [Desulfoferrobacter suflitae]MCK8601322.1 hypothetical protein [Desulfoferrobacter suflitae]
MAVEEVAFGRLPYVRAIHPGASFCHSSFPFLSLAQFGALSGFAVNLLIYAALRYFIRREQMMGQRETAHKDDLSLTNNVVNG